MKDIVAADMTKADAFATKVLAAYNPLEINLVPSNGLRWFYYSGAGDYLGRPDNKNTKKGTGIFPSPLDRKRCLSPFLPFSSSRSIGKDACPLFFFSIAGQLISGSARHS